MSGAYYNEFEPYAAQWLRNLIAAGHIAAGDVDERSIVDVHPDDIRGYDQAHFFAGIGGWSLALRLAGWADDRPVWTGSCPCQPFSAAGKQRGSEDERHLWPAFFRLISERRPATVFGEQVAGSAGLAWLDHVLSDLEGAAYAAAAAVVPAGAVGAPHRRERLWFVADATGTASERHARSIPAAQARVGGARSLDGHLPDRLEHGGADSECVADADSSRCGERGQRNSQPQRSEQPAPQRHDADGCGEVCGMADTAEPGRREQPQRDAGTHGRPAQESGRLRDAGSERMGDAERARLQEQRGDAGVPCGQGGTDTRQAAVGADARTPWSDLIWLPCADGKARPTQPRLQPLAHGVSGRVGRLRAYGNAIVPQVAAEFIGAVMECRP